MYEITLRGTPSQMGAQHGEIFADEGLALPTPDDNLLKLASDCEKLAIIHTPELVEEMQAFADVAKIPYDVFKTFTLTIPLAQNMPSCSVVAVMPERSATGKLMVGRNYDFAYGISWEAATTYHTQPDKGHAHLGNCDIWIGREDGLNDAGLFVAMSATFIQGVQAGLPFWFIVRHLLEFCSTVDEALAWIQSVPHSQSRNYMLADKNKALVVEASINGCRIREPKDGVLVMTNHPAHPDFTPRASFVPEDSHMRYNRLSKLANGAITLDDMQGALNDREQRVCAHIQLDGKDYGTIWSVIAHPADHQLAIAQGTGDDSGIMQYRSYDV